MVRDSLATATYVKGQAQLLKVSVSLHSISTFEGPMHRQTRGVSSFELRQIMYIIPTK